MKNKEVYFLFTLLAVILYLAKNSDGFSVFGTSPLGDSSSWSSLSLNAGKFSFLGSDSEEGESKVDNDARKRETSANEPAENADAESTSDTNGENTLTGDISPNDNATSADVVAPVIETKDPPDAENDLA